MPSKPNIDNAGQSGTPAASTVDAFIAEHEISMKAERSATNPNMDSESEMDHWLCVFSNREGRKLAVHFSTGIGLRKDSDEKGCLSFEQWARQNYGISYQTQHNPHKVKAGYAAYQQGRKFPVAPTAADVLDCLASDAAGIENAQGFDDWCSDYGYDTDSRKAEKTYNICRAQTEQLKAFLGNSDAFQKLLFDTERL